MAGSLFDAERLVAAVQELGGRIPVVLTNILTVRDMLNAQSAADDPAMAIVAAGAAGNLSEKKMIAMLAEAAQKQAIADYTGSLRATRIEPLLAREFSSELKAGAADELIDGLRPQWDAAAEFIGRARAVISPESSVEHFLATAEPGSDAIELWQGLNDRLAVVNQISAIVSHFGPTVLAPFPVIKAFPTAEPVEDRAVFCSNGGLTQDSAEFRRMDTGHKGSPWFRVQLRLHSVESATARYRSWCATEWDRLNDRPRGGRIADDGTTVIYDELPPNPFRATADA